MTTLLIRLVAVSTLADAMPGDNAEPSSASPRSGSLASAFKSSPP